LNALQLQLVSLRRAAERRTGELAREWVCDRVGQAIEEVARLVRLVSELMDVSRINAGQIDFELETVDFKQVIDAAMRRFEPQVRRGQIVVDAASVIGQWDPLRLDQIVTNLVSNAVKYGDGKPVEVRLTSADGQAVLEVRDRGIGIDPEQQQLLFNRFERLEPRRMYGGFGLGLWITRRIVDAMGGAIEVQSERGRGSVFRVSVPMESVRETAV
jgi:signal transduction histidine kinase